MRPGGSKESKASKESIEVASPPHDLSNSGCVETVYPEPSYDRIRVTSVSAHVYSRGVILSNRRVRINKHHLLLPYQE